MAMGSTFRHSCVDLAATPKPWEGDGEVRVGFSHSPALGSTGAVPGAHQWDVGHGVNHHALVLRRVLRDAA